MPLLDKLEVGVDLVREAVALSGLTLGQDVSAMIDIGADRLFDEVSYTCRVSVERILTIS